MKEFFFVCFFSIQSELNLISIHFQEQTDVTSWLMELDQNFQFLVVALVYIIWRLTSDMSDVTGKVGNIFCPLEKKK